jgi:hypothetical protein
VRAVQRRGGGGRAPAPSPARDRAHTGALGSAWRIAATAIFVSLAWLLMMLPLWNRLPDLAAVYLRLFFVR